MYGLDAVAADVAAVTFVVVVVVSAVVDRGGPPQVQDLGRSILRSKLEGVVSVSYFKL